MNSRQINLVLGAIVIGLLGTIFFMMSWARNRQVPEVVDRTNYMANTVTQITVKKFNATNLLAALANRSIGWAAIESTNYLFYIHNLRTIGCPEETIHDIIIADVAKLYARKRAAIFNQSPPFEYWRTTRLGGDAYGQEVRDQLRALEDEKTQLVKDLLGVNYRAEIAKFDASFEPMARLQGVFPAETRQRLQEILDAYQRQEDRIRANSGGFLLPEEEAALRDLELKRQEELSQVLTEDQMQTYELYLSPLAEEMRQELYGFEPTAEEFVEIFDLRKTFQAVMDSTMGAYNLSPQLREVAMAEAKSALAMELKSILGKERFDQYDRITDPSYQQLLRLSDRVSMPAGAVDQVFSMKNTAEQQKETILSNPNLTIEQRQKAIAAISLATESALSQVMGEDIFAAYRQAGDGWLAELGDVPAGSLPELAPEPPLVPPTPPIPPGPRIGDPIPPDAPFPFYQPPIIPPPPPLPNPVPQ